MSTIVAPSQLAHACSVEVNRLGRLEFEKIEWTQEQFQLAWQAHGRTFEGGPDAYRDEYLRVACLARARGAVETLEVQYVLPLAGVLERRCGDPDLVDETLQRLRQKLLLGDEPRLASYESTGHLRAWLQVVAVRLCLDIARQRGARWTREEPLLQEHSNPSTGIDVRAEKYELDEAFAEALRQVVRELPTRERHALRMHVLAGWNVTQIGEFMNVHRSNAARWIVAAKEQINRNVRLLLQQRLDLSAGELEHLFELFSTRLEVRLTHVFNTTPELSEHASDQAE